MFDLKWFYKVGKFSKINVILTSRTTKFYMQFKIHNINLSNCEILIIFILV